MGTSLKATGEGDERDADIRPGRSAPPNRLGGAARASR
jgi:hypothetical protein